MKHVFVRVVAIAVLAVSACVDDTGTEPPAVEPATTLGVAVPSTTAAPPASTTEVPEGSTTTGAVRDSSSLRADAERAVAARLSEDAPGSVTDEQIACVAATTVDALADERLSDFVAAYAEPVYGALPANALSAAERDQVVDAAVGCLPWTQTILDSLQDFPDVPPAVLKCAQEATPSAETDRRVADDALFGGDLGTVLKLVLPPDCLPQTGASQADTAAGRLTAAQLIGVGVSPENAACVAEQVDALSVIPPDESDTDAAMAAVLGCLTPEEMALLNGLDSP